MQIKRRKRHRRRIRLDSTGRLEGKRGTVLYDRRLTPILQRFKWSIDEEGYVVTDYRFEGRCFRMGMHRLVAVLALIEDLVVDHINHDTLDNRELNLRVVEQTYNRANSGYVRPSTSPFIGVIRSNRKWRAHKIVDGVELNSTVFSDPVVAARVADLITFAAFGKEAQFNFDGPGWKGIHGPMPRRGRARTQWTPPGQDARSLT